MQIWVLLGMRSAIKLALKDENSPYTAASFSDVVDARALDFSED